MASGSFSCFHH
uniref:Uncharacterized protein n=1 Tax=Musa acuminata subsp. malaccensis TaxID=214687 RepID=A0A804K5U1_MUSAM